MDKINWQSVSREKVLDIFNLNESEGLSKDQVIENRIKFGKNELFEQKPTNLLILLLESIKQPMILVLFSLSLLSFLFKENIQAITMGFVVILYILVEFINKYRTDKIITKLKALRQSTTKIIRESKVQEIPINELVVGDIILLTEGTYVPADIRLLSSSGLLVNEAALTGESMPIYKDANKIENIDVPLIESENCVFSGTYILDGQARGIVVAIGIQTEFGKITKQVQTPKAEKTLIQQEMTKLAKILAVVAIILSLIIPLFGYLNGLEVKQMILTWLSLTFLMIPGQPPIIITMALAVAAFELARKSILTKHLQGTEKLGQATSIITDKTGTITENKMKLIKFILKDGKEVNVDQLSLEIKNKISHAIALYSNDPTDKAVFAAINENNKEDPFSIKGFSSDKQWRDIIYKKNGYFLHAIATSPEILLNNSTLNEDQINNLKKLIDAQATKGNRVVAYGYIENQAENLDSLDNINLLAIAVLQDPIRSGVRESIEELNKAGIKTYIVTGDHPNTTQAIAGQLDIKGKIIVGSQIEKMTDEKITQALNSTNLFARVSPLQKLKFVKILQKKNEVVATIGDGINDAPAIKASDIGIAMGHIGTDIAKETADLILVDDNYAHIPEAVKICRKALDNFSKGLGYYLCAKAILLSIFIVPLLIGVPFPFEPIHIIIIELLMDLASSIIFISESAEPGLMSRPPKDFKSYINKKFVFTLIINGACLSLGILFIYLLTYFTTNNLILAQTSALVTWLIGHILLALNLKQRNSLFQDGFFNNKVGIYWLLAMVIFSLVITNVPFLFPHIKTTYVPFKIWLKIIPITIISTFWFELRKLW